MFGTQVLVAGSVYVAPINAPRESYHLIPVAPEGVVALNVYALDISIPTLLLATTGFTGPVPLISIVAELLIANVLEQVNAPFVVAIETTLKVLPSFPLFTTTSINPFPDASELMVLTVGAPPFRL